MCVCVCVCVCVCLCVCMHTKRILIDKKLTYKLNTKPLEAPQATTSHQKPLQATTSHHKPPQTTTNPPCWAPSHGPGRGSPCTTPQPDSPCSDVSKLLPVEGGERLLERLLWKCGVVGEVVCCCTGYWRKTKKAKKTRLTP